jgi:hypothetical protein
MLLSRRCILCAVRLVSGPVSIDTGIIITKCALHGHNYWLKIKLGRSALFAPSFGLSSSLSFLKEVHIVRLYQREKKKHQEYGTVDPESNFQSGSYRMFDTKLND